jgi:hypothetical protein
MSRSFTLFCAVSAIASSGCAVDEEARGTASSGIGSASASASTGGGDETAAEAGEGPGEGPGEGSGEGPGSNSGPIFDVGAAETGGGSGGTESGCQKVDFLFVIDNSASMENEQEALIGAFPGFMQTIQNTLAAGSDYHILVADTDDWGRCSPGNCGHELCDDPVAGKYACMNIFDACDQARGAGVVHPAGQFATNAPCTPFGGNRYLVEGEPDLAGMFDCMARVGVAGNPSERPMNGMTEALSPALNAAGGCNAGFLRDDAILVITFISDDPWYEDQGDPMSWYNDVIAAKNGDASAVVVLGLTPDWDGCRDGDGPPKGSHWSEFVGLWGANGLHGNVCSSAMEYVAFFEEAVSTIDETCDNFEPPG